MKTIIFTIFEKWNYQVSYVAKSSELYPDLFRNKNIEYAKNYSFLTDINIIWANLYKLGNRVERNELSLKVHFNCFGVKQFTDIQNILFWYFFDLIPMIISSIHGYIDTMR